MISFEGQAPAGSMCAATTPPPERGTVTVTNRTHTPSLFTKQGLAWNWNANWIQQPTAGSSNRKQAKAESSVGGSQPRVPVGLSGRP